MEIKRVIEEMRTRMPWIRWRVLDPKNVDAVVAKLGYDKWYDRCKYDVITFHENGEEKALFIWNLAKGPDRENVEKTWT
jgi:hypothetical protein